MKVWATVVISQYLCLILLYIKISRIAVISNALVCIEGVEFVPALRTRVKYIHDLKFCRVVYLDTVFWVALPVVLYGYWKFRKDIMSPPSRRDSSTLNTGGIMLFRTICINVKNDNTVRSTYYANTDIHINNVKHNTMLIISHILGYRFRST